MRHVHAIGVHAGAILVAAVVHGGYHATVSKPAGLAEARSSALAFRLLQRDGEFGPYPSTLAGAPAPHAWADWVYTSELLALDRPL